MTPLAAEHSLDAQTIIAILGALGLGAVLAAIVTGLFSKRKLGAEATKLITDAAASVVTTLEGSLARAERRAESAEARVEEIAAQSKAEMATMARAHANDLEQVRRVLQLHVAWDGVAIAELAKLDVKLPPAPPLLPPIRFTDNEGFPLENTTGFSAE